jgi:hypothetical protein
VTCCTTFAAVDDLDVPVAWSDGTTGLVRGIVMATVIRINTN